MLQRRLDLPDATVLVLQGVAFMLILGERDPVRAAQGLPAAVRPDVDGPGLWGVPIAVLGGAIRVSTPFLFVSLGECITERSGRINLGLEGILVMGAMTRLRRVVPERQPVARRARPRAARACSSGCCTE